MFKVREEEGKFDILGIKSSNVIDNLESGIYSYKRVKEGGSSGEELTLVTRYSKKSSSAEKGVFKEASSYIKDFFNPKYKEIRTNLGMLNKLNLMFTGKPGTGKTHLAGCISESIVKENNGIGIVVNNLDYVNLSDLIDRLRTNNPNRLVFVILDELEKNYNGILRGSKFLGYLDGADSRENVVTIATTNDISDLPNFLIDRKGRFEKTFEFDLSKDEDYIESTLNDLLETPIEKNLMDAIIKEAKVRNIDTIDNLRFLALEILTSNEKGESLDSKLDDIKKEIGLEDINTKAVNTDEIGTELKEALRKLGLSDSLISEYKWKDGDGKNLVKSKDSYSSE